LLNLIKAPGTWKFADLIVWHDDPYTVASENIPMLTIDLTMVGGIVVHEV
jgi:predicted amidohydrolase YtcJ